MTGRKDPVFLERRTYRRKRLADAVRVLPALGAALLAMPLFWSGGAEGGAASTTVVLLYVFAIWIGLAGVSVLLSRGLRPEDRHPPDHPGNARATDLDENGADE